MMPKILKAIKFETLMRPIMPIGAWYFRVSPKMITCREFNQFIFDYTENLLTEKQSKLFERHMKVCPMCRNFLKTYIAAYKAGKHVFPENNLNVPDTVPQDLLDAISAVSSDSSLRKR